MKILYYYWNENNKEDCVDALTRLGHSVEVWAHPIRNHADDQEFAASISDKLAKTTSDCIFSFNYFPALSEAALKHGIPYVSWVYDSPHSTLESVTLGNACNHVFVFDYALADRYRSEGFETVDYLPLPVNVARLDELTGKNNGNTPIKFSHDITFLGSLYDNDSIFYDQIKYLPDYLKGYLDALITAQELIYGMDLASQMMTPEICNELGKYVQADLGKGFRNARDEIFRNMVRKKVTQIERKDLLCLLGERFSLDLYSGSKPPKEIRSRYLGTADYFSEMPKIFYSSKINLNISLRSILTGIPLRVIDILGAGGFCLTNYQAELAEYFENGRELVWFESPDDMLDKAEYYLSHEEERIQIAANGHEAAQSLFSYDVLIPKIFASL